MNGPIYTGGSNIGNLLTVTFANLPASAPVGAQIYVSNIGEYGAVYVGNGTSWTHSGGIEIIQKAKGWIVPSLAAANAATYSQTGNIITVTSVGHNIPATNYNAKDIYLNMGAAATGATIPPGWFSNFTRTGVDTFTCVSATSQTGTGAVNTNFGVIIIPDLTCTITGGVLGLNGRISYSFLSSNYATLTGPVNKFLSFGGTNFYVKANASTIVDEPIMYSISNRNSLISQAGSALTTDPSSIVLGAIDTALDQQCVFSIQCTVENNFVSIHSAAVYITPS